MIVPTQDDSIMISSSNQIEINQKPVFKTSDMDYIIDVKMSSD